MKKLVLAVALALTAGAAAAKDPAVLRLGVDPSYAPFESLAPDGKRILFIIPDGTRTMPMPQMFALFREHLGHRAKAFDFLIALGTHQPMDDAALSAHLGVPVSDGAAGKSRRRRSSSARRE